MILDKNRWQPLPTVQITNEILKPLCSDKSVDEETRCLKVEVSTPQKFKSKFKRYFNIRLLEDNFDIGKGKMFKNEDGDSYAIFKFPLSKMSILSTLKIHIKVKMKAFLSKKTLIEWETGLYMLKKHSKLEKTMVYSPDGGHKFKVKVTFDDSAKS